MKRFIATSVLAAMLASPCYAATTNIYTLNSNKLLGTSVSTQQMQKLAQRNSSALHEASRQLGMTEAQYRQMMSEIANSHVAWVTVPRHLDAMSWQGHRGVHIIKDVQIPSGSRGWEVDLQEPGKVLALYIPAMCGNLSIIRRNVPVVAARRYAKPVAVVPKPVIAPQPVAPEEVAEVPPPKPIAAAAPSHHSLLPFLLPIIFAIGGGGGGGSSGPPVGPPVPGPPPGPPPPPCTCP